MASKDELRLTFMPMMGGIDERTQPELVDPSRNFLRLENVRADRRGAYTKRPGFATMSLDRTTGSDRASLRSAFANNGNLCTIDNTGTLDAYVEAATAWRNVGMVPECTVSREPTASTLPSAATGLIDAAHKSADMVEVNGYRVVVTVDATAGCYAIVYDADTGAVAYPRTTISSSCLEHDALVVAALDGTYAHVVYADPAGGTVYRRSINTAALSSGWGSETTVLATLSASNSFDAASYSSSWAIAATGGLGGAGEFRVIAYDDDATQIASVTKTVTTPTKIALGGTDTDVIWVANTTSTLVRVMGLTPSTLATSIANATIVSVNTPKAVGVTWTATGYGVVYVTDDDGGTYIRQFYNLAGTATALGSAPVHGIMNTAIASRMWLSTGSRWHILLTQRLDSTTPNDQKVCVVADVTDVVSDAQAMPRVVAVIAPRLELHNTEDEFYVYRQPCHAVVSGSTVKLPALVQRSPITASVEVVTIDYDDDTAYSSAEIEGCTVLGTGATSQYDGATCVEANWVMRPVITAASHAGGGGGITTTGVGYTYAAIYEWTDARGNVHRSAPSDPIQTGAFASKLRVDVVLQPLMFTNRQTMIDDLAVQVKIVLYRTVNEGSTYYRCQQAYNYTNSTTITFQDSLSDADLEDNEQLYTQPGLYGTSQPHACPPGLRHVIYHGEHIVGVGDDGYTIWPSAPYVYGEGIWWADLFQLPIPEGGPITALASSDGRLYAFKRDRIFVIDGDGPSDNGAAGQFSTPQRLPTELGCLSHRSVVVTPVGIFFQSPRGIEVLSGQAVQWVGENVQATFAAYPVITSAVCRQTEGRVLFTCTNVAGDEGVTLVFDYAAGAWTVDKVYDSDLAVASAPAVHALAIDGSYYRASSTGRVWAEQSTCLDNTQWITVLIETAWQKPSGFHGASEIPRGIFVGQKSTPCSVTVEWAYDYRDEYQASHEWDEPRLVLLNQEMGRIHLESMADENARGMSAKLRLSDAPPTNTSYYPIATANGITWFGYSIEAAAKPGRTHLPVSARAG